MGWAVARPDEVAQVVRLVCARRPSATVGITTAIHGAGGFGKTTVARMVRADRRVERRFRGRVYWVTTVEAALRLGQAIEVAAPGRKPSGR